MIPEKREIIFKETTKQCIQCCLLLYDSEAECMHKYHWKISRRCGDLCAACEEQMKKHERERMDSLSRIGCIICKREYGTFSEPEIHHLRDGRGMGHKKNHLETIPLCPEHHRIGPIGVGFHSGTKEWQNRHGSERDLLEEVNEILNKSSR